MSYLGDFPTGATVYIPFQTFNAAGASVTLTGLAVTDIEIYKNGSTTQRASDAGYTLLDTDGIDFDGVTGIHGFSIDTNDNTDAGFFAAGNEYMVIVASVTVDSQTVNFVGATFSIERAGGALALLKNATYGLSAMKTLVDDVPTVTEFNARTLVAADYTVVSDLPVAPDNASITAILEDTGTTLDALIKDVPTVAEFEARTLPSASYFDPAADVVAHVTLVDTTTTNTDMVAAAPTAAANADAVWDELLAGHAGAGSAGLALATASSGGVDPSVLADAVWDEALSGHSTAGTTGKKLTDLANADLSGVATQASVNDIPTVAEFEARTLAAADYVIVSDLPSVPSAATVADAVWDEAQAGHIGAGTFGLYLDSEVSSAGGGGLTTGDIADAVWDEALAGHVIVGSAGAGLSAAGSAGDPWTTTLPGAYTGNQAGAILDAIRDVTAAIDVSAVTVTASNDAGLLTIIQSVTFNATVSGLTISATWATLHWTLKESLYDDDDQAIIQLVVSNPAAPLTDGLLYLDSAAIVTPITIADGALTVNQAGGTVVIAVTDNATALLAAASELVWDIKTKDAAGATVQNTTGTASIVRAVTQTI